MVRGQFDISGADDFNLPEEESQLGVEQTLPATSEISLEPIQTTSIEHQPKGWGLGKLALIACGILSGIAGGALLWLLSLPPAIDCKQISALSPDMERLQCAQQAAQSGELPKLLEGMKTLEQWTPDNPLYGEAQRLMTEWSNSILTYARQKMQQSDYKGAVELAKQIPKSSPAYPDAQAQITEWQKEWQQFEKIYVAAQQALKSQNWNVALEQILALREADFTYWRSQQANALSQQLSDEKEARKLLQQANNLARSGSPEQLSTAITLLSQIKRKTFTWAEAQVNFQRWSENLLGIGFQHWQKGGLDQAIATAKRVSLNPDLAEEAENLIWLSHATKLRVGSVGDWEVSPTQLFKLVSASVIAAQIQPESRFYPQAQASLKSWRSQLQNVTQLQVAQMIANFWHPLSLQVAVDQAKQIPPKTPQRLQAQTLVAYWTREIERIEDRPYLTHARKLAEQGTIVSLQAAIAQAKQIRKGRALHGEAQSLIYAWGQQVEILEDQPILLNAQGLARQGRLNDAIQTAAQITPGRALYLEAQAAINDWSIEIRNLQNARYQQQESTRSDSSPTPPPGRDTKTPENRWQEPPEFSEESAPSEGESFTDEPPAYRDEPAPPATAPRSDAPAPIAPVAPPETVAPEPIEPTPPSVTVPTEPVEPAPPAPAEPAPPTYEVPSSTTESFMPSDEVPSSASASPAPSYAPHQVPASMTVSSNVLIEPSASP